MKIYVINKMNFDSLMIAKNITNENVELLKQSFFISINNTNTSLYGNSYFNSDKSNVKALYFDDCGKDKLNEVAMNINQAKELFEFIKQNIHKESCIVHCSAGISRSGAVGLFINEYLHQDCNEFKNINPQIQPNHHILTLMRYVSDLKN